MDRDCLTLQGLKIIQDLSSNIDKNINVYKEKIKEIKKNITKIKRTETLTIQRAKKKEVISSKDVKMVEDIINQIRDFQNRIVELKKENILNEKETNTRLDELKLICDEKINDLPIMEEIKKLEIKRNDFYNKLKRLNEKKKDIIEK